MGTRSLRAEFDELIRTEVPGRSPGEELALIGHGILRSTPLYINGFDISPSAADKTCAGILVANLWERGFCPIEPLFSCASSASAGERQAIYRGRIRDLLSAGAVYRIRGWDASADALLIEDIAWKAGIPYVDAVLCGVEEGLVGESIHVGEGGELIESPT